MSSGCYGAIGWEVCNVTPRCAGMGEGRSVWCMLGWLCYTTSIPLVPLCSTRDVEYPECYARWSGPAACRRRPHLSLHAVLSQPYSAITGTYRTSNLLSLCQSLLKCWYHRLSYVNESLGLRRQSSDKFETRSRYLAGSSSRNGSTSSSILSRVFWYQGDCLSVRQTLATHF
jgi:hypothetical protein